MTHTSAIILPEGPCMCSLWGWGPLLSKLQNMAKNVRHIFNPNINSRQGIYSTSKVKIIKWSNKNIYIQSSIGSHSKSKLKWDLLSITYTMLIDHAKIDSYNKLRTSMKAPSLLFWIHCNQFHICGFPRRVDYCCVGNP